MGILRAEDAVVPAPSTSHYLYLQRPVVYAEGLLVWDAFILVMCPQMDIYVNHALNGSSPVQTDLIGPCSTVPLFCHEKRSIVIFSYNLRFLPATAYPATPGLAVQSSTERNDLQARSRLCRWRGGGATHSIEQVPEQTNVLARE